jgi:two-component system, LuxR family, sensor kinase FixL
VSLRAQTKLALVLLQLSVVALLVAQRLRRSRRADSPTRSEERIALAMLPENLALWRWSAASQQFWATERFRTIIGLPSTTPLSRHAVRECIHGDDRGSFDRLFDDAVDGEGSGEVVDAGFRVVTSGGDIRWIVSKARIWRNSTGQVLRASGVVVDITDRKRFEAESERQQQQLAHLTRVAILGQLSGALAHELNQPLTSILSNAQAAQHFLEQERVDLSEVRAIVDDIVNDDKRAGEVIRRLRAMLRRGGTQIQQLDLTQIVHEVLALVHTDLVARKIKVSIRIAQDLPAVAGDRVQIQQVFLNLLLNASEAMNGNAARDRLIEIVAASEGAMAHVEVIDRGVGIAEDEIESVFDAFYTTKTDGLGLGLAISRSIISAHGGRLWATANAGRGSCFHFTLPALSPLGLGNREPMHGQLDLGPMRSLDLNSETARQNR